MLLIILMVLLGAGVIASSFKVVYWLFATVFLGVGWLFEKPKRIIILLCVVLLIGILWRNSRQLISLILDNKLLGQ